jgi:quercetin dioxygenase-like cupin family protein
MISRREACAAIPMLMAMARGMAHGEGTTLPSKIYNFDELPVKQSGSLTSRQLFSGKLFEGCQISMHESQLAPHSAPHPPHKHRHEEMVLVVDGTLEFTVNGKPIRAGAGSALFAGSNEEHGIRNPEDKPAQYFVFALGPENQ